MKLTWPRERVHKARCDYCGAKIAWSGKRRQWLAFAPSAGRTPLARRMVCPTSENLHYHDPRASALTRLLAGLGGAA